MTTAMHLQALLYSYDGKKPNGLTDAILQTIADDEQRHFQVLVAAGKAGATSIRLDECEMYLAVWNAVVEKRSWDALTPAERGQVVDAYLDRYGE